MASWLKLMLVPIIFYGGFTMNIAQASSFKYINYNFENGSPLFYEVQADSSVLISMIYDNERNSPNRAAGHWHFQVLAKKDFRMKLVLQNFKNIWNGKPGYAIEDKTSCYLSGDGKNWEFIETTMTPEKRLEIDFIMPDDSVYVARLVPYRISDLEKLKSEIENHPLVQITNIGQTVENRPLEIIRIGHERAPNRLFIRGRAHAWEPGGNWVIQGLIKNLLKDDSKISEYLDRYCIYRRLRRRFFANAMPKSSQGAWMGSRFMRSRHVTTIAAETRMYFCGSMVGDSYLGQRTRHGVGEFELRRQVD